MSENHKRLHFVQRTAQRAVPSLELPAHGRRGGVKEIELPVFRAKAFRQIRAIERKCGCVVIGCDHEWQNFPDTHMKAR